MPEFIDDDTFGSYFEEFAHTAWRLESRRGYGSDRTSEKYQRWLTTGQATDEGERPWCVNVRAQTGEGKRFERVRVADDPPTEEQRYLLAAAATNNAAGEDIRYLWRADADKLALPALDFWLFDSHHALVLHFDDADDYLGAELVDEAARIVEFCQIRDAAWHHAVRRDEFAGRVASLT
ncbi:DUF6879 family protein [Streptomyces sp. NPDC020489]|uniref:DUF6879 family protein n=1 Tax=Streptomyces sp. NPDC020489 TaxID=3365077 RepID=UPI00378DA0E9